MPTSYTNFFFELPFKKFSEFSQKNIANLPFTFGVGYMGFCALVLLLRIWNPKEVALCVLFVLLFIYKKKFTSIFFKRVGVVFEYHFINVA